MIVEPPAIPDWVAGQVELDNLRQHLRIDGTAEDPLILMHWQASIEELDGPGGALGRSLVPVIRTALVSTAVEELLPYRPVTEIIALEDQRAGVWEALDPGTYELDGDATLLQALAIRTWHGLRRVTYRAGYAELPSRFRSLLFLMVEDRMNPGDTNRTRAIETTIRRARLSGLA